MGLFVFIDAPEIITDIVEFPVSARIKVCFVKNAPASLWTLSQSLR